LVGSESSCNAGDSRDTGLISVGKIPWKRTWKCTPVFLPGESHGWRSLVGYNPWGCKDLDMTEVTERTHTHTHTHTYTHTHTHTHTLAINFDLYISLHLFSLNHIFCILHLFLQLTLVTVSMKLYIFQYKYYLLSIHALLYSYYLFCL